MSTTLAEPIVRPNGKPYLRRKPIAVEEFVTADGSTGVIVVGALDLELAKERAAVSLDSYELHDVEPHTRWLRLVPWDEYGCGGDRSWVDDQVRGMPCVEWMPEW